jgi:hypothetical protein
MFGINTRDVIKGHVNELLGRERDLSETRMRICRSCPLFTDIMGGICDSKKCVDKTTNKLQYAPGENTICGCSCRLEAKSRLKKAKCVLDKWPTDI